MPLLLIESCISVILDKLQILSFIEWFDPLFWLNFQMMPDLRAILRKISATLL